MTFAHKKKRILKCGNNVKEENGFPSTITPASLCSCCLTCQYQRYMGALLPTPVMGAIPSPPSTGTLRHHLPLWVSVWELWEFLLTPPFLGALPTLFYLRALPNSSSMGALRTPPRGSSSPSYRGPWQLLLMKRDLLSPPCLGALSTLSYVRALPIPFLWGLCELHLKNGLCQPYLPIYIYLAEFSKRCSLKLYKKASFCHKKP